MGLKYEGIKKGYPRLQRRFGRLAAYVALMRPFTLIAPISAGVFLTLAPVEEIGLQQVHYAVYVGVTLALLQAAGQVVNQYADADLDRVAKPYRPVPQGRVSREEAMGFAWLLALLAVARAFTVSLAFGLFSLLIMFSAVFYSLPPFSPRRVSPVLNLLWLSASRGLLPVMACFTVYSTLERALPYSALAFLIVLGWQGSKDVEDVEADRMYGVKTVANTYGLKALRVLALASTVLYVVGALLLGKPLLLLVVPVFVFGLIYYAKRTGLTENVIGWTVYYASLALYFLLVFVEGRL